MTNETHFHLSGCQTRFGWTIDPKLTLRGQDKQIPRRNMAYSDKKVKEIILAFNPDLEGESTGLYLYKLLLPYAMKLTRLARGLPRGADIEYADEITLADAIKARREV